ncbi:MULTISPECIES: hypothetical protein [unclassified Nonomuraea]|uniref:hypothetical protein n=1 Tax=unclassified Nonomuraea TaxID=2593643 RepID=UPI0033F0F04D
MTGTSSQPPTGSPAEAMLTATDVNTLRCSGVNRTYGLVRPSTCSANVAAAHPVFMHLKRRIITAGTALIPLGAASASR